MISPSMTRVASEANRQRVEIRQLGSAPNEVRDRRDQVAGLGVRFTRRAQPLSLTLAP
jgi:hypothetical protein